MVRLESSLNLSARKRTAVEPREGMGQRKGKHTRVNDTVRELLIRIALQVSSH